MSDRISLFEEDLPPINQALESKTPQEIIQWAFSVFPRMGLLTSGQKAGSVLAKMIFKMEQTIDLIFADTEVHFPETLQTIEQLHQTYHFPLKRYTPQLSMQEQTEKYGVLYLNHAGQEKCCHMRKVEPLFGLHHEYEALMGPLRRGEGGRRSNVPIVALDMNFKVIRLNPMANLREEPYQEILNEPDTIINPLHFQGFPTIGCARCTTPVRNDEAERAGRWRHLSGADYCGINPSDVSQTIASIDLPAEVVERLKHSFSKNVAYEYHSNL